MTAAANPVTADAGGAPGGDAPPTDRHAAPAPGRRDRKKLETRRAIRLAALELVAARGYANVTVEDIAEAADVSPRTFFNYFASKEAAVAGADPDELDRTRTALLERPAGEPVFASLRALALARAGEVAAAADECAEGRAEWFRRMKAVHQDPALAAAHAANVARYERALATAIAERLGVDESADPYPALLATTVIAASRVAFAHWARTGGEGGPADALARVLDLLAGGLAGPAAPTAPPETREPGEGSAR